MSYETIDTNNADSELVSSLFYPVIYSGDNNRVKSHHIVATGLLMLRSLRRWLNVAIIRWSIFMRQMYLRSTRTETRSKTPICTSSLPSELRLLRYWAWRSSSSASKPQSFVDCWPKTWSNDKLSDWRALRAALSSGSWNRCALQVRVFDQANGQRRRLLGVGQCITLEYLHWMDW